MFIDRSFLKTNDLQVAKPPISPVAAGRVLVRKDVYDIPSDSKEGADNESLASSEGAIAKARGGEKRKRSNISADNDRPASLEEDEAEAEGRDKESVAPIIVEKGKKVKVAP